MAWVVVMAGSIGYHSSLELRAREKTDCGLLARTSGKVCARGWEAQVRQSTSKHPEMTKVCTGVVLLSNFFITIFLKLYNALPIKGL